MRSVCGLLVSLLTLCLHVGCCSVQFSGGCGASCMPACETGCVDSCGPGFGAGLGGPLVSRLRGAHCDSGCGEVYWDEQINEPRQCDPCGCDNSFVGGTGCGVCPGGLHRLRELWGFRYVPRDCDTCSSCSSATSYGGSCASCSSASDYSQAAEKVEAVRVEPNSKGLGAPTPAKPRGNVPEDVEPQPAKEGASSARNASGKVAVGSGAVQSTSRGNVKAKTASSRSKLTVK